MNILAGLGNPGTKYEYNRHNVGFLYVDYIVNKIHNSEPYNDVQHVWKKDQLFQAELAKGQFLEKDFTFVKPQTFMNNSGISIQKLLKTHNMSPSQLIVAHDDLDIPFGKFKIQLATGPKIHNGINSIEQHLKTADFWRIRIGVDNRNPENHIAGEEYVLQNFTQEDQQLLPNIYTEIISQLNLKLS